MEKLDEIRELCEKAAALQLGNAGVLQKYTLAELSLIYNGIGPAAFPKWLRELISALHPSLAVVALIHDVEWHETDKSEESFTSSNERFKENGYKVAKAEFSWYDPRRYIVMNQARRFGNYCQIFGRDAWNSDCTCGVCCPEGI